MKRMTGKFFKFVFIVMFMSTINVHAQQDSLSVNNEHDFEPVIGCTITSNQLEIGSLFQKSYHFYWENGITATYRPANIMNSRLGIGLNILSSKLGSALGTNAIRQNQILVFGQYDFRPGKSIRPFVQANFGYIKAQFDQLKFSDLELQSLLMSINAGVAGTIKENWILKGSQGYNIIGSNGRSGLATIYPFIFHLSAQYIIKL
jgi:hypothetical protein